MLTALVSAVLQVVIVLLVCAIVYWLFGRRAGFARYLGLIPTTATAIGLAAAWGVITAVVLIAIPGVREAAAGDNSAVKEVAQGQFTLSIALALAIKALLQTSLSEELFFRGLIGKRLIAKLGFATGNAIQAAVFGAVHLLLLIIPQASHMLVIAMAFLAGAGGWVNGWLNERLGKGSIVPGWVAHGATNLVAYLGAAYLA